MISIPGRARLCRATAVALCCLAFAGCQHALPPDAPLDMDGVDCDPLAVCKHTVQWIDKTGRNRGQRASDTDMVACWTQVGGEEVENTNFPNDAALKKARLTAWGGTQACMAGHGWGRNDQIYFADTSGRGRGQWQAEIDAIDCDEQNVIPPAAFEAMSHAEQDAVDDEYIACMGEHGWKKAFNW